MVSIAIVGMACRYPDARSPVELWENALAQRRAFRRMPSERLCLDDYHSADPATPDATYGTEAAVIDGYEFDRVRFRVAGSTFRSADLAHWLALDVAADALADAGFPEGEGLPRASTGVLLGNTLTGEFSRASVMRLRWPYVRRVLAAALAQKGWPREQQRAFLEHLEAQYKTPFPPVGEETLAGGLSNTIAGRICNYFDLKGGGYTVDGACASSLLAVSNACSALVAGDLDVAVAGGVDLSLDPFELVGFAKTRALAPEEMRVYDARSAGFWPGEGCGLVVLMRYDDALAQERRIHAVIRGWGISSDGHGGITRPEVEGQVLALQRAYRRAGFGIDSVSYFEGHGTGTGVGDATELKALSSARREAAADSLPAVIGTIKANIGHTKAAAGVAGLIKATMAVHDQILPPTTGCEQPHAELTGDAPALRVLDGGEIWPAGQPLRAGVSAMGFGGINTHFVLEGLNADRRRTFNSREQSLVRSAQDAELFLLSAPDAGDLRRQTTHLSSFAARLARSELADLAAQMEKTLPDGPIRAAVVASSPAELADRLAGLETWLEDEVTSRLEPEQGLFLSARLSAPRIGFLFPGQGSPVYLKGGALGRRFQFVHDLYTQVGLPSTADVTATEVAQPAIVTAELAGLQILDHFGVAATVAVGHSLGELPALHWAGAFDEQTLLRIASARGQTMGELESAPGAMASIAAGADEVGRLLNGELVVKAGLNSPRQTVIAGETSAVAAVVSRARARGLRAVSLSVSHAFHSPLVAAAAPVLAAHLAREVFRPLRRRVISTVTGGPLQPEEDLRALLCRQVTSPVRFVEAVSSLNNEVDLWLEVGPGQVLSGLVHDISKTPVFCLDSGGTSLKGLLHAVGAAYVLGAPVNHAALFSGRFTRPFDLDWRPRFFVNPCELAPKQSADSSGQWAEGRRQSSPATDDQAGANTISSLPTAHCPLPTALEVVRQLVAQRAELPVAAVQDDCRLLDDLHLNSISVGQLVAEAGRRLGLPPPASPTDYADATVAQVAQALEELARTGVSKQAGEKGRLPSGVDSWIRTFTTELVERTLTKGPVPSETGSWRVIGPPDYPLAESLKRAFTESAGDGVVVCLPPDPDERHVKLLLEGARLVLERRKPTHFVLVQHGGGGAAFARTLHLEAAKLTTCIVDVPVDHPRAVEWVLAEARAAVDYVEVLYGCDGRRREPVLRLLPAASAFTETLLGPQDVLLVSGGGKGIAAECALSLARETGVRLALLGRSRSETDAELQTNLDRMTEAGVPFRYVSADVTDEAAVRGAVEEIEVTLGAVTAILHGAGANVPRLLSALDETAFLHTLAPKLQGARNILAAVDPARLRLLVTFGSIIARTGMRGEADYAVANEWLTRLTERWQAEHPHCRCLAVEWSVWSGVGMGERLGRIDALLNHGITPIPPDEGMRLLRGLLGQKLPAVAVVVTGRFGEPPTVALERPELPLLRFLERPRIHYPGVELVAEADLSADTDPYLDDHVFRGDRLFPAVMGLEAMAQAAMALAGTDRQPTFEDVQFSRPIAVAQGQSVTIRIAALVRGPGRIDVVVRSAETAFAVDHFRATCLIKAMDSHDDDHFDPRSSILDPRSSSVPLDPAEDLYGGILFQAGRFRRLRSYHRLKARECIAEIAPYEGADWFGRYLPAQLMLGDAATRDVAIHAIQACIPHATVLPIGVERIESIAPWMGGNVLVHARERLQEGNTFIYDLEICAPEGKTLERWRGLTLRIAERTPPRGPWAAPLLGPYLERRIKELIPRANLEIMVDQHPRTNGHARSAPAFQRLVGSKVSIGRRPDGKPEAANGHGISAAHVGDLTLAAAGPGSLACDTEPVVARRAEVWRDLLGEYRFGLAAMIARETKEDDAAAATRVWTALECLKKAGAMVDAPLTLVSAAADGWVKLAAGSFVILTFIAPVRGIEDRLALAVLVRNNDARL